jgi:IS1 family transposase
MRPYVPNNISKYCSKRNPNATKIWSFMAVAPCLHVFCAHDWVSNSTSLFWDLLDALSAPERVPWCTHYICKIIRRVWSRCHEEHDQRVNYRSVTMPSSSPKIIRSGDFQSPPCCQSFVPRTYHYLQLILVYIPIANLWERSCLFHTVSAQPTIYDMFSIVAPIDSHHSILYIIVALFYFQTLG